MKATHQMFLQSFMWRGIFNASDVFALHKSVHETCGEMITDEEQRDKIVQFVGVINASLKGIGMEIKKGVDEVDGSSYYALVNTTESSITLCASQFTGIELEFFKKLVELIVNSDKGVVGSISALHLSDSLPKKMTTVDAEYLLEKLKEAKWIGKTDRGKLYLSTRAILELEQYILDMYPDVALRCNMCKKLAIQGQTCSECSTKLHNHCFNKFFKDKIEFKCPVCKETWDGDGEQPSTSGTQVRKRKGAAEESGEPIPGKRLSSRKK